MAGIEVATGELVNAYHKEQGKLICKRCNAYEGTIRMYGIGGILEDKMYCGKCLRLL